jgi:hypothetical protein
MSIKLGSLIGAIKRAVVDAQHSVAEQHMEELAQYFVPAPGQDKSTQFPQGEWEARTVTMHVPREVSQNGKVSIENHAVHVPLITLLPLRSSMIDRVELLTTLDLSLAPPLTPDQSQGKADLPPDVVVNLGHKGPHSAEVKIVVHAGELPPGYARLVGAYEKVLNAQLPT